MAGDTNIIGFFYFVADDMKICIIEFLSYPIMGHVNVHFIEFFLFYGE